MRLPAVQIESETGKIAAVFFGPHDIQYGELTFPAVVWDAWTEEDWAEHCPKLKILPLVDERPTGDGFRFVRLGQDQWVVEDDCVRVGYDKVALTAEELEAEAAQREQQLVEARVAAVASNNDVAGRAREAFLTAVPGQATTYAAKQAEVTRWIGAGRPADATATVYPWAGDRADLRSVTVADVLAEWEAVTAAWELVGRQIERERERVNEAIGVAGSLEAVEAARRSAAYPAPSA